MRPMTFLFILVPFCLLVLGSCSKTDDPASILDVTLSVPADECDGPLSWRPMVSGTDEWLWGVWGVREGTVHTVGNGGVALFLGGPSWAPRTTGTTNILCDVWVDDMDEGFAVGMAGTILRHENDKWSLMESGTTEDLFGVFGEFAVGANGTILRYDGASWQKMESGTDVGLFGVWGSPSGNVYAVGVGGTILSYDGNAWAFQTSNAVENLSGVYGFSDTLIYAAGDFGTLYRYDGSEWMSVPTGTSENLYDVWGIANNDIFVVGATGTILHFDGNAWTPMTSGTSKGLFSVWGDSECNAFAVGMDGTILRYGPAGDGGHGCDDGKARALTMKYTGDDCDATNHDQDPGDVACSGDPMNAPVVRIVVSDRADPDAANAKVWFDGMVALGAEFAIDATNAGETQLRSNAHVRISDTEGVVLQTIKFHVSCSQPLNVGDQFGSLLLTGFTPDN